MKKHLILIILTIWSCSVLGQGPGLANINLKQEKHYSGYLENNTTHERLKIMWYPAVNAYRLCNKWDLLKTVPPGYTYIDEDCNCGEDRGFDLATHAAPSNIQFDFDSSILRPSSYPVLDNISADLKSNQVTVTIAGYASSEGTAAHNMRLSKDRANSVKTYLVNSGVDPKRLKIHAFGETHPIADNSTEEGRTMNRRVEFQR